MSELSFLIELLLNHDLPKITKDLVAERIKDVERNIQGIGNVVIQQRSVKRISPEASSIPIEEIAKNEMANQALINRQAAIEGALKGENKSIYKSRNLK